MGWSHETCQPSSEKTSRVQIICKISKCTFGAKEVKYLGYILTADRPAMRFSKTRAIEAWKIRLSKNEVQSFLGLINYYRSFIKDCSKIAKPFIELTKDIRFTWNNDAERVFKSLRNPTISGPVLRQLDPSRKIYVTTDPCRLSIGAVMEQVFENGRRPIFFASKILNSAQ